MGWKILLLVASLLSLIACRNPGPEGPPDAAPAATGQQTSSAEGAEGAMCKEHGVLEAVCTKCNPKLIPIFQAKGDWCAEHGFPESFCPLCHPEKGGKPAVDVSIPKNDGAPADGTKVRFKSKDTARLAGLQTAKAVERPNDAGVFAVARLAYDRTRMAAVNARSPAMLLALKVDVGARVRKGAPLAVLRSATVGADRSRLLAARSRVEFAEAQHTREKSLHDEGISSLKALQDAQQEREVARAELATVTAALGVVGSEAGIAGEYTLTAPLSGIVTKLYATPGQMLTPEQTLFEIVDTSVLWAELDIAEADLPVVASGQAVALTIDGLGARELIGKIDTIAPELDPRTRTTLARVRLENPDGTLRANMYGQAHIAIESTHLSVLVPRDAVQHAKGIDLIFVRLAEDQYEARRVEIGAQAEDMLEVKRGVSPGEEVVTTGSFLLKTETLKESIGAGCCDVE